MQRHERFFAIRWIRFKFRLSSGSLILRRYRFRDTKRLYLLFRREFALSGSTGAVEENWMGDLLHFTLWLHRTFQWVYIISQRTRRSNRILGFIGIYNMRNSRHATLAVMIFDPLNRGLGYGTQALRLLLDDLRQRTALKSIRIQVSRKNSRSLAFFYRLGFRACL